MVTTATPAPEIPAPAPGPTNSFARIVGVIFSPKATFASIAAKPSWIVPVIIAVFLGLGFSTAVSKHIGWTDLVRQQMAASPRAQKQMESLSADQRERAIANQAKIMPYIFYSLNVAAPFIGVLLFAAIFMGIFNAVLGARIGFKTSLGVMSYAWIPQVIAILVAIPVLLAKDPSTIGDINNFMVSNPGALLSDDSPKWLVALLGSFDIFSFWTIITLSFGFSAADSKKLTFGKALGTIIIIWVIYVFAKVGLAAAFS
jgi:Yip1 domain